MTSTKLLGAIILSVAATLPQLVAAQTQNPPANPPPAGGTSTPSQGTQAPATGGSTANQPQGGQLPQVEVIQERPRPRPRPVRQAPRRRPPPPAVVAEPAPPPPTDVPPPSESAAQIPDFGSNIQMSPMGGSEIPITKVPGGVSTVSSSAITEDGTKQVQESLLKEVPGIVLSDASGNPLRAEISYRGFDASPVGGRSQGLAVYQDGVRVNEAFGDTVNLDVIPNNAIEGITIIANNPVFGLNAIGGAMSIVMKDGFSYQGGEIDIMGGSFGRSQVGIQAGAQSGPVAAYIAAEGLEEEGFRDFSDSEIRRLYADLGAKNDTTEVHLSLTAADNKFGVTAAAPVELLADSWRRTFTSPQDTEIEVLMPTLRGSIKATDTLTFSGLAYYRRFKSNVIDGNLSEVDECAGADIDPVENPDVDPTEDYLCGDEGDPEEPVRDQFGDLVEEDDVGEPRGSIERIGTSTRGYGGSVQAVEKGRLFGLGNQFLIGASYDHANVRYNTSSELGTIGDRFVVTGSGIFISEPDDAAPRVLDTANDYYGVYFSNTLDITDQFSLTLGGRYNHATIRLEDLTGEFPELTTTNKYSRFNPMVGGTYEFLPGMSFYGGYSEANRAPTAAELGCAEPTNPCLIESFLTDDPPLEQVVSHTFEAGVRNTTIYPNGDRFKWNAGYFRTLNTDDILNVVSAESTGRGFFLNAGDTLRQGFEIAAAYRTTRYEIYGSYVFVDATFRDNLILPAPNTPVGAEDCPPDPDDPTADTGECNYVQAGDSLPGIPRHRFKTGIDYWLTPEWKVGADLIATSDQFFFGDEANNNAKLSGYTRVDLHTSYDINSNLQIYGLVRNLFDKRYAQYGTFFDTDEATEASTEGFVFADPRTVSPAMPFAAYGGVKLKF